MMNPIVDEMLTPAWADLGSQDLAKAVAELIILISKLDAKKRYKMRVLIYEQGKDEP